MHIYFSGIGGVGLGPLAQICLDTGFKVSGSDLVKSPMFEQLQAKGAVIHVGQERREIKKIHDVKSIDWFVYSSALPNDHAELTYARESGIKATKRDELLAYIIKEKDLKLIAVSGTHGKTTTTAMIVWLFKKLNLPVSYSIGASLSWRPSGAFEAGSKWFIYECDEFDRNFLAFNPYLSLITSIDYDHPDTYPTKQEYINAFRQFVSQSERVICWGNDKAALGLPDTDNLHPLDAQASKGVVLAGEHNRRNGALVLKAVHELTNIPLEELSSFISSFPGTSRRFEKLSDNLYSDYAHHPVEIAATLQLASEISSEVVVVYQPHQNIRQYEIKDEYAHCFNGAKRIYWLPTYQSREDPTLALLTPEDLVKDIDHQDIIVSDLNDELWHSVGAEREKGSLVLLLGAGTIDGWAREKLAISQ